jgi:hypothetical protein
MSCDLTQRAKYDADRKVVSLDSIFEDQTGEFGLQPIRGSPAVHIAATYNRRKKIRMG